MYTTKTASGYEIKAKGYYSYTEESLKQRTIFIIAERKTTKDFMIGLSYNIYNGTWGQGIYDFKTLKEAKEYMIKTKKLVEFY